MKFLYLLLLLLILSFFYTENQFKNSRHVFDAGDIWRSWYICSITCHFSLLVNRYLFTDSYLVFPLISSFLFLSLMKPAQSASLRSNCHLEVKTDKSTNSGPLKDICIQTGMKILNLRAKSNCNSTKRWNSTI